MLTIDRLLKECHQRGASDLHLTVNSPPMVRVDGSLIPLPYEVLDKHMTYELTYSLLSEAQREKLELEKELDFGFSIEELDARYRANAFYQRTNISLAIRAIPLSVPTIEQLGLPKAFSDLADRPSGLILVTGPTGCCKSTSIAAMIDQINSTRSVHIITI